MPYLRTAAHVKEDFIEGVFSAEYILPERVRVEDCRLVLMNIRTFLERIDYLDYTYNPLSERSLQTLDVLKRLVVLLQFYRVILTSEAMKNEALKADILDVKKLCYDKMYGMYDTFDAVVQGKAQEVISIVEAL